MPTGSGFCFPWRLSFAALASLLVLASAGCGTRATAPLARTGAPDHSPDAATRVVQLHRAISAQELASTDLLSRTDVVGTGAALSLTGGAQVLVLLVSTPTTPLPTTIDGVPVVAQIVGSLRPWSLTTTARPLVIGVSAGNANECTPGTIGCVVQRGAHRYVLSANHVFARQNQALLGEIIVQPSLPDLSADCSPAPPSAAVAQLTDFTPVVYDGRTANTMDAAIAELTLPSSQFSASTPPGYYGFPSSTLAAVVDGMAIMKLGRTTELTHGQVKAVNVKTKIVFASGTAVFTGQVMTSPGFGGFGDSGSLVLTDDGTRRPVGMLIGGTSNGSGIVTPIGPVLARFNVTVTSH